MVKCLFCATTIKWSDDCCPVCDRLQFVLPLSKNQGFWQHIHHFKGKISTSSKHTGKCLLTDSEGVLESVRNRTKEAEKQAERRSMALKEVISDLHDRKLKMVCEDVE